MNKKALTLLEILVSLIIISLVITGLASTFVIGKRYIYKSRLKISGAELGKYFLDSLQRHVNYSTWYDTDNSLGPKGPKKYFEKITIDDRDYKGTYEIDTVDSSDNLTKVTVSITLPAIE